MNLHTLMENQKEVIRMMGLTWQDTKNIEVHMGSMGELLLRYRGEPTGAQVSTVAIAIPKDPMWWNDHDLRGPKL